jgi:hypothetical protein
MNRPTLLAALAVTAAVAAAPVVLVSPAEAQIDVQIGRAPPPQGGPYGDRDRDGIPNRYDRHDDRRGAYGDRDHDGIPNRYDRFDNRMARDRDGDGVPQRYDRDDRNPYRQ